MIGLHKRNIFVWATREEVPQIMGMQPRGNDRAGYATWPKQPQRNIFKKNISERTRRGVCKGLTCAHSHVPGGRQVEKHAGFDLRITYGASQTSDRAWTFDISK